MESEFITLCAACREAEWLKEFLCEYELWPQPMTAISLHCDSNVVLSRAYSDVYNGKSRHISMRHTYVREMITNGVITLIYAKSGENLTDPLTIPFSKELVVRTSNDMSLKYKY